MAWRDRHDSAWVIDPGYWNNANSPITRVDIYDNVRRDTGLLDTQGRPIFREPRAIGFGEKPTEYSIG